MKKLDYQKTFDGILTNVEELDFHLAPESELLFKVAGVIPVYKNNQLMARSGGIIAYISLKGESMRPFIMVDSIFETLSLNAKVFAIYHELGHYQNGDFLVNRNKTSHKIKLFMKNMYRTLILKEYPEKEVLADYYAMDKMGSISNGISALEEINEVVLGLVKNEKKAKKIKEKHDRRMESIRRMIEDGPYFINNESISYEEIFSNEDIDQDSEENNVITLFGEHHADVKDDMVALADKHNDELTKIILNEFNKSLNNN